MAEIRDPGAGPAGQGGHPARAGVTRKTFLRGLGAAGAGGLVVGAAAGFAGGSASGSSGGSGGSSKKPIVIGSGSPVTGIYAGDGQMMVRGQQLAIAEINAAGGVLGRPLQLSVLDTQAQQPDVMKTVFQKFVSQGVAAVFAGFTTYSSVEFPVVAQAGIPTFHVNTWHGNVDFVRQHGITNIFQGDPSETWYGPGFIMLAENLIKTRAWTPSSKTMAIVTSNDPYSLNIAQTFQAGLAPTASENTSDRWPIPASGTFSAPGRIALSCGATKLSCQVNTDTSGTGAGPSALSASSQALPRRSWRPFSPTARRASSLP